MEKWDFLTSKISILFKKIKFINVNVNLTFEENIAKVFYRDMQIPEKFQSCLVGIDEETCEKK